MTDGLCEPMGDVMALVIHSQCHVLPDKGGPDLLNQVTGKGTFFKQGMHEVEERSV